MLFPSKAVGLEITQDEVRFVLVGGKPGFPRLDSYIAVPLPGEAIRLSTKDPNIQDPAAFSKAVKEGYLQLLTNTKRISVSLPDSVGRVMLLDLETRFSSRDEGRDIIRWKLKKLVPLDVNDIHLDYQVLTEKESGEISTLVSLVSRQVVTQYEEVLAEAGLEPSRIDFTTFNRYRLFSERLEFADYAAFVSLYGKTVSILIFNGGILEFYRSKDLPGATVAADRIFREVNSSLLVYREKHPGHVINQVFYTAASDEGEVLRSLLAEAAGVDPVSLDVERVVTRKQGLTADRKTLSQYLAAIGAAMRNL